MNRRGLLAIVVAAALAGCESTPAITTDSDPQADFSGYRTYTWAFQNPPQNMSPLAYERTRASIDRELAARGFTQGDPGDFAVAFTLGRRDRVEVTDFGPYGAYYYPGYRYRWGWGYPAYSNVDVRNVTDGTLVIDIYDVATRRPVWHGMASKTFGSTATIEQSVIDGAVTAVLNEFPPAQGPTAGGGR